MAFIHKWIEGEKNLHDYCKKRFGEKPKFCGTIGHVGEATVHLVYKLKQHCGYVPMYLLFMQHPKGETYDILETSKMTYEDIRLDRTAILV